MALSDLAIFSDYAYTGMTEVLAEKIELFNSATGGGLVLTSGQNPGDYNDSAFFINISGLVRRRNPYASGSVSTVELANRTNTSVKVAAGTPPINISPSMFSWIKQSPELAGAVIGKQMAVAKMQDMLSVATKSLVASNLGNTSLIKDITAATDPTISYDALVNTMALMGDASQNIVCWIMHSKPAHNLYGKAVANSEKLFTFDTINIMRDPFGKLFVITDNSALVNSTTYYTLGLTQAAAVIEDNGDFFANESTTNGLDNIVRTYQAEWSYNASVKGYTWDKANGSHAPSNAALATSTNWDKTASDNKDCASVLLKSG